jgi:hypothetical protein
LPEKSRLHKTAEQGPPGLDEYLYRVVNALDEVAKETGKTIPQIPLNWLLQRPTASTMLIDARDEAQLRQNLAAVGWNLTPEQVVKLDAASARRPAYPYWHQDGLLSATLRWCTPPSNTGTIAGAPFPSGTPRRRWRFRQDYRGSDAKLPLTGRLTLEPRSRFGERLELAVLLVQHGHLSVSDVVDPPL